MGVCNYAPIWNEFSKLYHNDNKSDVEEKSDIYDINFDTEYDDFDDICLKCYAQNYFLMSRTVKYNTNCHRNRIYGNTHISIMPNITQTKT